MAKRDPKTKIRATLETKSQLKQLVYDNTLEAFTILKEVLQGFSNDLNKNLQGKDNRIMMAVKDHGEFDCELKVAGDLLVFSMHSNIFQFDRNHEVWKTAYIKNDPLAGFSAVINIYNFLADSFKYNRFEDLGYLIARIFINKDKHFFVQGKRQSGFNYASLGDNLIDKPSIEDIVEAAIQYCLDFDLLVPPYDTMKVASVGQIKQVITDAKITTGKRLGFQFNSDDINK